MKREILPTIPNRTDEEKLADSILESFLEGIFKPVLSVLAMEPEKLENAPKKPKSVREALLSFQIQYQKGRFTGKFNADISKELRSYGAKWDSKTRSWAIPRGSLPVEITTSIGLSESMVKAKSEAVIKALDSIDPKLIKAKTEKRLLEIVEKTSQKNFNKIRQVTVPFQTTEARKKAIADEYTNNLEKYIQDFSEKEITNLRENVIKLWAKGYRYDSLIKEIKKSYGVSYNKAKFLARQETNILVASINKEQFTSAGSTHYRWKCVTGTADHPVRPMHKALDNTIQAWDSPPITDEQGNRNHPMGGYNCRCTAIPIFK